MEPSAASDPPATLLGKFAYYRAKYGVAHAIASYIGRLSPGFWQTVGPLVTRRYLNDWLASSQERIVNLGGGSHCLFGCLTADVDARADVYLDVTLPLPFPDASLDAIFCEEVIEHVDEASGQRLLVECNRTLKPGSVLRLTTPSLDWFAERVLKRPETWIDVNAIFYDHQHRCIYSEHALRASCSAAGFANLTKSSYQDKSSRLGYLDSHADRYGHLPEMSQYLEAIKPIEAGH